MDRRTCIAGTASAVSLLVAMWGSPAAAISLPDPLSPSVGVPAPAEPGSLPAVPAVPDLPPLGGQVGSTQQSGARLQAAGSPLTGQFVVSDGKCGSGATPTGSYFSMLDPLGSPVGNANSPCSDKSATPVAAGTDGLVPGRMQPFAGSPADSRAIIAPTTFFGTPFAVATEGPDKQSGTAVQAPTIMESGGKLSGQISAFQAFYNGAYYNQGAPKPGGGTPGRTTPGVSGTLDATSGAFVLEWRSTITGGAFNNFTGVWHLEGTFKAAAASTPPATGTPGGQSSSTGAPAAPSGTSSAVTAANPTGGPLLANTGLGAAETGFAALGLCAIMLALGWRRLGSSN